MNRRGLRRAVKRQREALRARVKAQRAALAAARRARRGPPAKATRADWARRVFILIAILIYLLLRSCDPRLGAGGGEHDPVGVAADAAIPARPPRRIKPKRRPSPKRLKSKQRPSYKTAPLTPPSWLSSLRMQVAARGPRLARCFEGSARPGSLRWTAALDAEHGLVSDHDLEPILRGASLSPAGARCVIEVLSKPPYRLEGPEAAPPKISLVIEF